MAGKPHHYEKCNTKACPTTKTGKFSQNKYLDYGSPWRDHSLWLIPGCIHATWKAWQVISNIKAVYFFNLIYIFLNSQL